MTSIYRAAGRAVSQIESRYSVGECARSPFSGVLITGAATRFKGCS